jgi:hypothetical protein
VVFESSHKKWILKDVGLLGWPPRSSHCLHTGWAAGASADCLRYRMVRTMQSQHPLAVAVTTPSSEQRPESATDDD